jgi:hypothetical protein
MGQCNDCEENNIPTVNEESLQCCEFYPADCVKTTVYQSYFNIGVGKTLTNVIDTIAKYVKKLSTRIDDLHNYSEHVTLLSQASTNAPTATVVKNELSGSIVYAYVSPGTYTGTLVGAFTAGKTVIEVGSFDKAWGDDVKVFRVDADTISIRTGSSTDYIDNDVITDLPIVIRVYN